jgi:hypothetical protein
MISIANSNCPAIEHKNQVRRMFYFEKQIKFVFTDLATESFDSVAGLR